MIPMLLSYINENITMLSEAVLMKITLKLEVRLMKKYRVSGSGIDENRHIS